MIDNFLGIDTDMGEGRGLFFFFLKDRSSLQYFITQGMGQSSMFRIFRTIIILGGGLRLWLGWGRERRNPRAAPYLSIMKLLKNTTCS